MKKIKALSILAVLLLIFFIAFCFFGFYSSKNKHENEKISIRGITFNVEIAQTPEKRYLGLSGRERICSLCGMLFKFENFGIYSFTMRGMNFPLDIIWINDGKIVNISKNIPTSQLIINPNTLANQVLEINAGLSDEYGFKTGDEVELR